MAKCLRCGAGNEWIQGKVKDELVESAKCATGLATYGHQSSIDGKHIPVKDIYERTNANEREQSAGDYVLSEAAPDCGDTSCMFGGKGKGGQRTNGGCRCIASLPSDTRRYFYQLHKAMLAAPSPSVSHPSDGWISPKVRMPENGVPVLCCWERPQPEPSFYGVAVRQGNDWHEPEYYDNCYRVPEFWQPITHNTKMKERGGG